MILKKNLEFFLKEEGLENDNVNIDEDKIKKEYEKFENNIKNQYS